MQPDYSKETAKHEDGVLISCRSARSVARSVHCLSSRHNAGSSPKTCSSRTLCALKGDLLLVRFSPCDCMNAGCFRCAVGFVISSLGLSPDCECFRARGGPCRNRCGRLHEDFASAYKAASSKSTEWARRRAVRSGLKLEKVIVFDGDEEIDFTQQALAGHPLPKDWSSFGWKAYDPAVALLNLIDEVEADQHAYDSARIAVGHIIETGGTFPLSTRERAAALATGALKRPKKRGKSMGATAARDRLLCHLINEVIEAMHINPTSASREQGDSACGAVSEGLRLLGLQPYSYSHMEKIWLRRKEYLTFGTDQD